MHNHTHEHECSEVRTTSITGVIVIGAIVATMYTLAKNKYQIWTLKNEVRRCRDDAKK